MKTKSKLLILKKIVNNRTPASKKELLKMLEQEEIIISLRTLERYLKELIEDFFIEYSNEYCGYVKNDLIDEEEFQFFMHLLNVEIMSQLAMKGMHKRISSQKHMVLSSSNNFKGLEYVQTILEAIEKNKSVSFTYKKQYKIISQRTLIPQLLKEYQNRWYLIGLDMDKNEEIRTFGLDRIENLKISIKLKFKRDNVAVEIFENIIGVDTRPSNEKYKNLVKVVFKAIETMPNYFKSLPLHKSQKIVDENSDYTIFSVVVLVNYEFNGYSGANCTADSCLK